jgi:hypothetical protein
MIAYVATLARSRTWIRGVMLAAAFLHGFPATKHLRAFFAQPSWGEAWKGFGALAAIAIYMLPPSVIARAVIDVWRKHRVLVALAGWTLAWVHLVPALDHVPRFVESPTWGDGWRGIGALTAALWFVAPVSVQCAIVRTVSSWSVGVTPPPRALTPP